MHILEIVIGLVFVMLLFSLLATTLMETIAGIFALRGEHLKKAIRHILAHEGVENQIIKDFESNEFYQQLCGKRWYSKKTYRPPSYISSNAFWLILSSTLFKGTENSLPKMKTSINELTAQNKISPHLRKVLLHLIDESENEDFLRRQVEKVKASVAFVQNEEVKQQIITYAEGVEQKITLFKNNVEQWYENVMERTSGWYKRQTQYILLGLGLVMAIAFNADAISIYQQLSSNPEIALKIADAASKYVTQNPDITTFKPEIEQLIKEEIGAIRSPLGIGWDIVKLDKMESIDWIVKILGWIVTAFSVTLGAPFWFDLLKKLVNIRNSGAPSA